VIGLLITIHETETRLHVTAHAMEPDTLPASVIEVLTKNAIITVASAIGDEMAGAGGLLQVANGGEVLRMDQVHKFAGVPDIGETDEMPF
jgi:hypothetical protein